MFTHTTHRQTRTKLSVVGREPGRKKEIQLYIKKKHADSARGEAAQGRSSLIVQTVIVDTGFRHDAHFELLERILTPLLSFLTVHLLREHRWKLWAARIDTLETSRWSYDGRSSILDVQQERTKTRQWSGLSAWGDTGVFQWKKNTFKIVEPSALWTLSETRGTYAKVDHRHYDKDGGSHKMFPQRRQ